MSTPTIFTLFSSLPSELRIKIWKYLVPGPRVVPVRYNFRTSQYTSTSAPPALLHACHESRTIFLSSHNKLTLSPKYPSTVFVDFKHDTIFFDSLDCSPDGDLTYDLAKSLDGDKILNVAVDAQLWEILRVFRYDALSEVRLMRNLKNIAIVISRDSETSRFERQALGTGMEQRVVMSAPESLHAYQDDIRHVNWYVDNLTAELEKGKEDWGNGTPSVQMWLW